MANNEILYFLKFGEREHMEQLAKGYLYFSNAITYRGIEEILMIKGQGDILEGGSKMDSHNMTMIDNETNEPLFQGIRSNMLVHYEPANLLPVFCLFCCFEKDCFTDESGKRTIQLSEEIKRSIIEHFPKADSVAIISNPIQFINDVRNSVRTDCKSGLVNYFHLEGFESEKGIAMDMEYFKYLAQDIPPKKEYGKTVYSFNSKYVYRSLLCKDIFFIGEQEYRFILPKNRILRPQSIPVALKEKVEIESLDEFLKVH